MAREFWLSNCAIYNNIGDISIEHRIASTFIKEKPTGEYIHVIEKSAYDKAIESLRIIGSGSDDITPPFRYMPIESLRNRALETLRYLGEFNEK